MARTAQGASQDGTRQDQWLLTRASAGDEDAFEAIVARYRPLLLRHAGSISRDGAEDAVQQALMNAWTALRRGNDVRELRPWLITIARRAASGALREAWEREQLCETFAVGRSPAEHAENAAQTRETLAAIAALPERERDALVWTSIHGRSGRDAARELGVSEDAVRALVRRARTRLRAAPEPIGAPHDAVTTTTG